MSASLKRTVGLSGAIFLGLGSIVGTGVFVSLGLAAEVSGTWVVPGVFCAGLLALCNGLSSAQLAAAHPTSGGTYEYGYRFLSPAAGFSAGWMFLCAKSASAAAAALGGAGYLLSLLGVSPDETLGWVGGCLVLAILSLLLLGMRRSNSANTIIVSLTLIALGAFVLFAGTAPSVAPPALPSVREPFHLPSFLQSTALLFVAYTGYGRIATLGEEVLEPAKTIPKAVLTTLGATLVLYSAVAWVAISAVGPTAYGALARNTGAPLEEIARLLGLPTLAAILGIGAVTAMLGVLLNLNLGLSRVLLAMGRRGDMPSLFSRVSRDGSTPVPAVIGTGLFILLLSQIGDLRTTWSFSAFTVLIYYAITNVAAFVLPAERRKFPKWISIAGLLGCLGLAFWVEPKAWMAGSALLAAGLIWHKIARRLAG